MPLCGGVGATKEATSEVQALCELVKAEVEAKCGKNFTEFNAISYATQVVAGTNYFVKLFTGGCAYIHASIFEPLPHTNEPPSVQSVQQDKRKDDPIGYF